MKSAPIFEINTRLLWAVAGFVSATHIAIAAFALVVGIFGRGLSIDRTINLALTSGALLFAVVGLLITVWHFYKVRHTTITEAGVGQPTLRGWVQLNWRNVQRVKLMEQQGFKLYGSSGSITISLGVFRNKEKVLAFLLGKLSALGKV